MLTRRDFAGIASCALCAVTGFIATDASAQGTPSATTPRGHTKSSVADRRSDAGICDDHRGSGNRGRAHCRTATTPGDGIRLYYRRWTEPAGRGRAVPGVEAG